MSRSATGDRRILRAFYTQYVAVLLILLVFCVGTASNEGPAPLSKLDVHVEQRTAPQLGVVVYEALFTSETSAELKEGAELQAVIEMLRNHDIRATFTLYADMQSSAPTLERAVARAYALKARLLASSIPVAAIKVIVAPILGTRSSVDVVFESWGKRDDVS